MVSYLKKLINKNKTVIWCKSMSESNQVHSVFACLLGVLSILMTLIAVVLSYVAPVAGFLAYLAIPLALLSSIGGSPSIFFKIFIFLLVLSHWGSFFTEDTPIPVESHQDSSPSDALLDNNLLDCELRKSAC
jgi:hypothetical protein